MLNLMSSRTAAITIAGCAVIAAALSAQSASVPPAPPSTSDALLAEIKALRADLNQRLDASIRAQLLVARVQVQEQRISTLSRQLADVQQQLQNNERARAPLEEQVKMFEKAHETDPERKEANFPVTLLRGQLEAMTKADEELRNQQVYLTGLIAEEQSRWTAFNARLEELEQLLTASPASRR
jgi:septal ring factor EnvC (AmiA/AmiB activator)